MPCFSEKIDQKDLWPKIAAIPLIRKLFFSFYAFNLRAGIRHHIIVFASAVNRIDEAGLSKRYFFQSVRNKSVSFKFSEGSVV